MILPQAMISIKKKKSTYLAAVIFLLGLVLIGSLFTQNNLPTAVSENSDQNVRIRTPHSQSPIEQTDEMQEALISKKRSLQTTPTHPTQNSLGKYYNPTQEKYLKTALSRNDSHVTVEKLEDGTELFHFNGSRGHFSAASVDENGEIQVQCHSSFESLEQQVSQSSRKKPNHLPK